MLQRADIFEPAFNYVPLVHKVKRSKTIKDGYLKCQGCTQYIHPETINEYRLGVWCSRVCAFETKYF